MNLHGKYSEKLHNMPAPGTGCHHSLLGAANYGIMAGVPQEDIFSDLRASIPAGTRKVHDKEIEEAIQKAARDHSGGRTFTPRSRPAPVTKNPRKALQTIIDNANISDEITLQESSPIRLRDEPAYDAVLLLRTLYDEGDFIFAARDRDPGNSTTIRPVCELVERFEAGKETPEFFIINPLSGMPAEKKSGGLSYRADGCVKSFKYCLAEFDNISLEDQIRFWSSVKLPIRALTFSGSKSIHALLDVAKLAEVVTLEQWATHIKDRLYDSILNPLGVDAACSNPARLSRLPGHYRTEKQKWQRLLWLSAEGRPIQC